MAKKRSKIKTSGIIVEDTEDNGDSITFENQDEVVDESEEVEEIKGGEAIEIPNDVRGSKTIKNEYLGAYVPQMEDILKNQSFKRQLDKKVQMRTDLLSVASLTAQVHTVQLLRDILVELKKQNKK